MAFINQIVLITGAGSGIGEAIAIHFAKLSARLSLVDVNEENLKATADTCEKILRTKVLKQVADLAANDNTKAVVEKTYAEYGRIDVVINCAGIFKYADVLSENIIDDFDKVMSVNVRSIVAVTNAAAPKLIETKGSIVNISSVCSRSCSDRALAYHVSKACISTLTRCAALELAAHGVRVNAILPGPVVTNILINSGKTAKVSAEIWEKLANATPLKHAVKAEEIAELAAFLSGEKARSITGTNNVIDSGLLLKGSV